jgi:RNA polymerase sigma-70 factor (ECF subfamily)
MTIKNQVRAHLFVCLDVLERLQPTPIVSLNRAVAVAMVKGPRTALALIDELAATAELDSYHLLHAARADLLRRIGSSAEPPPATSAPLRL